MLLKIPATIDFFGEEIKKEFLICLINLTTKSLQEKQKEQA